MRFSWKFIFFFNFFVFVKEKKWTHLKIYSISNYSIFFKINSFRTSAISKKNSIHSDILPVHYMSFATVSFIFCLEHAQTISLGTSSKMLLVFFFLELRSVFLPEFLIFLRILQDSSDITLEISSELWHRNLSRKYAGFCSRNFQKKKSKLCFRSSFKDFFENSSSFF